MANFDFLVQAADDVLTRLGMSGIVGEDKISSLLAEDATYWEHGLPDGSHLALIPFFSLVVRREEVLLGNVLLNDFLSRALIFLRQRKDSTWEGDYISVGRATPFYVLRKVSNEQLLHGDSAFEMARADMGYLEFLWKPASWKAIVVDAEITLKASQALFWWKDNQWHLQAGYGIAADCLKLFSQKPVSQGKALSQLLTSLRAEISQNLEGFLSKLQGQRAKPMPRLLLRVGQALPLFFEPHARFVLSQGNVYLLRMDQSGNAMLMEDRLGNSLMLPDQTWLLLYGYGKEEAEQLLQGVSAIGWEELFFDWQTMEVQGNRIIGPVLLDRVAGACFEVYRRLVEHVYSDG